MAGGEGREAGEAGEAEAGVGAGCILATSSEFTASKIK